MEAITVNTKSIGPLSNDQLFQLCRENPDLRIERKANGQLIFMTPTGGSTGHFNLAIEAKLYNWFLENRKGIAFNSSTGFLLPDNSMLSPDAAWINKEKWDTLSREEKDKFPPVCPDFVIELRSPSDALKELKEKMETWIQNGAQTAWLIDPVEEKAYIYKPGKDVVTFESFQEKMRDDEVLPGFELDLGEIKGTV